MITYVVVFFFKQKTAYEMRISDWSSDVCSSDLSTTPAPSGLPYPPDYLSQKIDIELFARPPSPNPNPKPNTFSSSQGDGKFANSTPKSVALVWGSRSQVGCVVVIRFRFSGVGGRDWHGLTSAVGAVRRPLGEPQLGLRAGSGPQPGGEIGRAHV